MSFRRCRMSWHYNDSRLMETNLWQILWKHASEDDLGLKENWPDEMHFQHTGHSGFVILVLSSFNLIFYSACNMTRQIDFGHCQVRQDQNCLFMLYFFCLLLFLPHRGGGNRNRAKYQTRTHQEEERARTQISKKEANKWVVKLIQIVVEFQT